MEEEGREDTLATKQSWSVDESLRLVVVAMAMAMAMEVAFASGTHGHDTRERGERREAANNNKKRAPAAPQRKSSLFLWPLAPKANRYRALRARREPYSPRRAPGPSPICSPRSLDSPALLSSALVLLLPPQPLPLPHERWPRQNCSWPLRPPYLHSIVS